MKEHQTFTDQIMAEQENQEHGENAKKALNDKVIDEHVKILNKRANDNFEAIKHRDDILEEGKMIKQFETFLETAPQTVLQLYIIFQLEPSEVTLTQWRTLAKCFIFFLMGAMSNYLGPTKVSCYLIKIFSTYKLLCLHYEMLYFEDPWSIF